MRAWETPATLAGTDLKGLPIAMLTTGAAGSREVGTDSGNVTVKNYTK